jgi:uncharacterized protein YodC (DUF2158 family)
MNKNIDMSIEGLNVGDVVRLKSGSEPMTIVSISDDWVTVSYYVHGGQTPGVKRELYEPDPAIFIKVEPENQSGNGTT